MRDVEGALAWLEGQRTSGSTAWHNMCESLCRQAYGLAAHYSSAELHANAIPSAHRYGHEAPARGDLVLYRNGGHGHIVVATGNGWQAYTNDYGGRGRVTITDARDLVAWCGASSWFTADAWWSSSSKIPTHSGADMALTDADVARIAKEVWRYAADGEPRQAYNYLRNIDADVWAASSRTLTSAGGPPVLSDADVNRIAEAVAEELGARLRD
jgi:hypothetical protein